MHSTFMSDFVRVGCDKVCR